MISYCILRYIICITIMHVIFLCTMMFIIILSRTTKTKFTSAISPCQLWRIISTRLCCLRWCKWKTSVAVAGPSTHIWWIKTRLNPTHLGPLIRHRIWNSTRSTPVGLSKSLSDLLWKRIKALHHNIFFLWNPFFFNTLIICMFIFSLMSAELFYSLSQNCK